MRKAYLIQGRVKLKPPVCGETGGRRRSGRPAPTAPSQRRLPFETWQHTGNVALACRTANVGRRALYYWQPRFDAGGFAALEVESVYGYLTPVAAVGRNAE